jgi:hypothetical protein
MVGARPEAERDVDSSCARSRPHVARNGEGDAALNSRRDVVDHPDAARDIHRRGRERVVAGEGRTSPARMRCATRACRARRAGSRGTELRMRTSTTRSVPSGSKKKSWRSSSAPAFVHEVARSGAVFEGDERSSLALRPVGREAAADAFVLPARVAVRDAEPLRVARVQAPRADRRRSRGLRSADERSRRERALRPRSAVLDGGDDLRLRSLGKFATRVERARA